MLWWVLLDDQVCVVLQCIAVCCRVLRLLWGVVLCCSVLQCAVVCYSGGGGAYCVARCCTVLQFVAVSLECVISVSRTQ